MTDVPPDSDTPKAQPAKARKGKTGKPKVSARTMAGVGAAIGIGSAAIVAALLYSNRNKKS